VSHYGDLADLKSLQLGGISGPVLIENRQVSTVRFCSHVTGISRSWLMEICCMQCC